MRVVVFDTNVLISAALLRRLVFCRAFHHALSTGQVLTSNPVLEEDVLEEFGKAQEEPAFKRIPEDNAARPSQDCRTDSMRQACLMPIHCLSGTNKMR